MSDTPSPRSATPDDGPPATTLGEPMARRDPHMSLKPGVVLGGYRIEGTLGQGGMGRVYLAHDDTLGRRVALKVLPPEEADEEARARFLREAQALARVQHEHVVQVFASGSDGDVAWMALEYVEGDALGVLLGTDVDEETAVSLCAQAARGLAAVHAVGVVHRDVKPDNLLIDRDGVVRVLDFGVALFVDAGRGGFATQAGVAIGTPHFMAPEQARGGVVDARADAWGLGATLYALLVGKPPFFVRDDESDLDILARVLRERAPDVRIARPTVSAATAALLARLLEPDLDKRDADLSEIAEALFAIGDALASGAVPEAPAPAATTAVADEAVLGPSSTEAAVPVPAVREPVPAWFATAGVIVVALLFLVLGAALGPALVPAPRAPDAGPVARVEPPRPPPPVVDPVPPPIAEPLRAPPSAVEPAPPTPAERAASIVRHPDANLPAIKALVDARDDDSRATLALVLDDPGEAADLALSVIAAKGARQHVALVDVVMRSAKKGRAIAAVSVLKELKSEEALARLQDAALTHPNAQVRDAARAAAQELFSVE